MRHCTSNSARELSDIQGRSGAMLMQPAKKNLMIFNEQVVSTQFLVFLDGRISVELSTPELQSELQDSI